MKKFYSLGVAAIALAAAASPQSTAFAQSASVDPEIIPEFYSLKMSNDGKILISQTSGESMSVYYRADESMKEYELCSRGLGNSITDNGTIVGGTLEDKAFIITDGVMTTPKSLSGYAFCNLHGITPDGTRICGLVNNPKSGGSDDETQLMYLPMYVDVTAGEVSEPVILPYPEKDFVNLTPQYCTAIWISDDGRTILGQVIDNSGLMPYPILYKQAADGTWSYTLPTKDLLNPENLTLPPYPVAPEEVDPTDYMTADKKAAYEQAYAEWEKSNYDPTLYPDPTDYMTEEKKSEYLQDMTEYNAEAQIFNEKLYDYYDIRNAIFDASVGFVQNTMTLNREGTMAASTSVASKPGDFEPIQEYAVYILDLSAGTYRHIDTGRTEILPGQIVADGTVVCSSSATGDYVTRGYLVKKGSDELLPIQDYLGAINPEYNTWIIDNLSCTVPVEENGDLVDMDVIATGRIAASDDMSVIAGAVPAYLLPYSNHSYFTYIFDNLTAGINNTFASDDSTVFLTADGNVRIDGNVADFRITDMEGRALMHMNEASGHVYTGLESGMYIISYFAAGERHAVKVMVRK